MANGIPPFFPDKATSVSPPPTPQTKAPIRYFLELNQGLLKITQSGIPFSEDSASEEFEEGGKHILKVESIMKKIITRLGGSPPENFEKASGTDYTREGEALSWILHQFYNIHDDIILKTANAVGKASKIVFQS